MSVNFGNGGNAGVIPPATDGVWATKDIVYLSFLSVLMAASLLEWFLFLASFDYCLVKIFQKAEDWSTKIMSIIIMVLFTALRLIYVPIIICTLPLPTRVTKYFPKAAVDFLMWFAFWSFSGLLVVPWLLCLFRLITHRVGKKRKIKQTLNEESAPKVVVVMPVYNEPPEVLLTAINSVVTCDYPASCIHVFVSFDGDAVNDLYLSTIKSLGIPAMTTYPKCIDVVYCGARITVSRFPHGGKRGTQKKTFTLIDKIYVEYLLRNDNLFILFIDSDCILDAVCIQNFMYDMELKPGSDHNMLAMTGVITCTTDKHSFLTILQDIEYIHGQLFERTVESACGAVTCLPGALTMLRFSAFRRMAKFYFADKYETCNDLFDYAKCHLGEDRWLTHLFMVGAQKAYQIQMCNGAFCKTEAVQDMKNLLKQRRRWFLGSVTNEACMLTDIRLWTRYPVMCLYRFMQCTIRTTALLFFMMVLALCSNERSINELPVAFLGVSMGLNWLLMFFFGIVLGRYKVWLYPVIFICNPFFNWMYMCYGAVTAGQRTWGGPRADAATADEKTTPLQAIEQAEATGDDLNIIPETFKPSTTPYLPARPNIPLLPPANVVGRFAAAERLPGGWYLQGNDSVTTVHGAGSSFEHLAPPTPLFSPTDSQFSLSSYINEDTNSIFRARPGQTSYSGTIADQEVLMTRQDYEKLELLQRLKEQKTG